MHAQDDSNTTPSPESTWPYPSRFVDVDAARRRFGARVDRLGSALMRADPLADDVVEMMAESPRAGWHVFNRAIEEGIDAVDDPPEPLRAFFAAVDRVPLWLEDSVLRRGGEGLLRAGVLGGLVLSLGSLVYGYAAPAGNKPLVFSGRLTERAARRLNETARFVHAVSLPGGMRRHGDGFAITLKVRIMHAQVRRLCSRSPRWRTEDWGVPINQHDMLATCQLFSTAVLEGLSKLGIVFDGYETERYMLLWRYIGELMGVEPDLLPSSWRAGKELADLILATQGPPDEDSRALVDALIEAGPREAERPQTRQRMERRLPLVRGICRGLIGDALADELGLPDDAWKLVVPALRAVVRRGEDVRRVMPGGRQLALRVGRKQWRTTVEQGLAGVPATFEPPDALGRH